MYLSSLDFKDASQYAIQQLEQKLSPIYTYHSLWHTRDEVVEMADHLAKLEGINGDDRIILLTGAYFHDIGFTRQRQNHELVGIQYVGEVLPQFGYSPEQIQVVQGIILATRLPQTPLNLMEQIVADADLDVLGRLDFWNRSLALKTEVAMLGTYFTDQEWCERQYGFLMRHQYFTTSAHQLRNHQKQRNISFLLEQISIS